MLGLRAENPPLLKNSRFRKIQNDDEDSGMQERWIESVLPLAHVPSNVANQLHLIQSQVFYIPLSALDAFDELLHTVILWRLHFLLAVQ